MSNQTDSTNWSLVVENYQSYDYGTELTLPQLEMLLSAELNKEFNSLTITDKDGNCISIFYKANDATVLFRDRRTGHCWSSYNIQRVHDPKASAFVRLTPNDAEDFSFEAYRVIPKQEAIQVLKHFIAHGGPIGLYLVGEDGKPQLS